MVLIGSFVNLNALNLIQASDDTMKVIMREMTIVKMIMMTSMVMTISIFVNVNCIAVLATVRPTLKQF